jgi:hypothetical protein
MRGGALGLKGLEAYPHHIYIGFYHRVGMKYVLQKDLLALSTRHRGAEPREGGGPQGSSRLRL